jgi:DNA-binding CsgD family transcriptional regulator
VLARLLLAQGRPGRALVLLDRLHAAAMAQGRDGSIIEIGALRALALAASGEEPAAVTALAGTLMLASPQGYVRVFADEGQLMARLLGRLVASQRTGQAAAGVPLGYLARLQRAFDFGHRRPGPGPDVAALPGIVDPLTGRELEVLRMLAAGKSNQSIAGELVVALDTVKKHVGHILGKLGAANRTEAVARARELTLIRLPAAAAGPRPARLVVHFSGALVIPHPVAHGGVLRAAGRVSFRLPGRLTSADPEGLGAWGWTAAAEDHRDGDHGDGGEKPGQDHSSPQAAVAVRRLSPARA